LYILFFLYIICSGTGIITVKSFFFHDVFFCCPRLGIRGYTEAWFDNVIDWDIAAWSRINISLTWGILAWFDNVYSIRTVSYERIVQPFFSANYMFSFVVLCVGISCVLYVGALWGKYEVVGSLNSRGYFRLVAESSFPSASGFFYLCKKCEADPSCSVSCPFDDSQFYKV